MEIRTVTPSLTSPALVLTSAAAVAIILSACGDGDAPATDAPEASRTTGAADAGRPAPCEVESYPCTWGEVGAEARRLTDELGWVAADIIQRTASVEETAAFLRGARGVEDVWEGPFSVQFRVRGGRPAWVDLPTDPENPRLGGGASRILRTAPPSPPSVPPPPAQPQQADETMNGVAALDGEEGTGKRALVLSPVAWQLGTLEDEVKALQEIRDYSTNGGGITYRANLDSLDRTLPPRPEHPVLDRLYDTRTDIWREDGSVEVRLDDFRNWNDYNFIYLLTHGRTRCTDAGCYTILETGQRFTRDEAVLSELEETRGVELSYTTSGLNRRMSDAQWRACIAYLSDRSEGLDVWRDEGGVLLVAPDHDTSDRNYTPDRDVTRDPGYSEAPARCYTPPQAVEYPIVNVTTEFFRSVYSREGRSLDNVVIFLAACQSLKGDYLVDVLTAGLTTENVAIFGFDEVTSTEWTAQIGPDLIWMMGELGMDSEATYQELSHQYPEAPLTGVFLSDDIDPGGEEPTTLEPARLGSRSTNPTHARDVVELVNPLSGEELEDGGTLVLLEAPADGQPDSTRVGMRVRGIDSQTDTDQIDVFLEVDGRPTGRAHELTRQVEPQVWEVGERTVELGFDVVDQGVHDLEIRASLEGGGESRWRYEDIRFARCFYHATWSGPFGGSHSSPYIRAQGPQVSFPDPFTDDRGFGMSTRFPAFDPPELEPGEFRPASVEATFEVADWEAVASYDADSGGNLPAPVVRIHEVTDSYVRGTVEASLTMTLYGPKPFDPNAEPLPRRPFQVTVDFQYARHPRSGAADCPPP